MRVLTTRSQELSARDDDNDGRWGPVQIATPAIVGGVLIILFVAYILWRRRQPNKQSYSYHQVKNGWVARIEQIFVPRRVRVVHSSTPITLDDSMRSPGLTIDFRKARRFRPDSTDSQTPLTSTTYGFGFPAGPKSSETSPPTVPKRHPWRWWQIFGIGPQEIKSQEPGSRWRIDDHDASSSGHGSYGHERAPRYVGGLEAVDENPKDVEVEDSVIRIGDNFTSLSTPTPMTQQFPERERMVRVFTPVAEISGSSGGATSAAPTNDPQSARANSMPSWNRNPPQSYNVSQSNTRHPTVEDLVRPPLDEPYMLLPPPVRAAGYGTPRMLHERQLSSDSFLAAQTPMTTLSIY